MGTPFYMSPEQARGDHEVGPASDLYSFGVMLYEMVVGALPITGDNYNQLIYRVMSGDYRPARERRPDVPEALDQIIAMTMAIDPAMRPTSAAELEHALLELCRPQFREHVLQRISSAGIVFGTSPPQRISQPGTLNQGTDPTLVAPSSIRNAGRKSRLPWILAGLLVAGGGAATIVALQLKEEPKPFQATETPAPAPASAPTSAPTPAPAPAPTPASPEAPPAAAANITVKFAVEPKDAIITVDGTLVHNAELTVTKDDSDHALSVTAPGFKAHEEQLRFDESQKLVIHLDRVAKATPTPPKKPPKKPEETKHDRIDTESPYK
jgi:serine/threonine-protein kinase